MCAGDGETYERSAIEEHFRVKQAAIDDALKEFQETNGESNRAARILKTGITSPMGHGRFDIMTLTPNRLATCETGGRGVAPAAPRMRETSQKK